MTPVGRLRRAVLLLAAGLAALVAVAVPPSSSAAPAPDRPTDAANPARWGVRVYDYDLGDRAFKVYGFHAFRPDGTPSERLAPLELTGRVYVPPRLDRRPRVPMVVIGHGLFWTCANERTGDLGGEWPCTEGRTPIHSDRGYDYLGLSLARRGFLVVSIGENGVNAGELGEPADRARGLLTYRHLELWRELVQHGRGPLAGALVDARTGRPATPDLRHEVDLRNVGLLGHSRGGRGMMWAAADNHRRLVPDGVRLRAVFGLAPAEPPFLDQNVRRVTVTRMPLMAWIGGCDATGDDSYNILARRGGNPVNIAITVHGANHNHLNARWAANSGLPGGEDDAAHPPGRPGRCYSGDDRTQPTLGYGAEHRVAELYVGAFFARHLQGKRAYTDVLQGHRKPARDLTRVVLRRY